MRAYEFYEPTILEELFNRKISEGVISREQLLLEGVFENQEQIDNAKSFIQNQKQHSLVPEIGKQYAPVGIVFTVPFRLIVLYSSDILLTFTSHHNDYIFNNKYKFPGDVNINASVADTLFYSTVEEANTMISLILLALQQNGWKLEQHIVQSDGTVLKK